MNDDARRQWRTWRDAAGRAEVDVALRQLYEQMDSDIASRSPTCWLSGKCCKFDTYGHKLYATGLEIAWLLAQLDDIAKPQAANLVGIDGCPFQIDKLCGVHAIRPLGCRIFFCDPSAKPWMNEVYEHHLSQLRRLHQRFNVPYRYMEWRHGLAEARVSDDGASS